MATAKRIVVLTTVIALVLAVTAWAAVVSGTSDTEPGDPQNLAMMVLYASLALIFSFLCSVAEAVLLSVSTSYIAHLRQEGKKSAKVIERVKIDIDKSLAGILTLNTRPTSAPSTSASPWRY
jgi:hypothetical protein